MRWQCSFQNENGIRCENEAIYRIHFSNDHPFDHYDVCTEHLEQYQMFCWVQDLTLDGKERAPC